MRVRITLGVLCTATGRANPTFFTPIMSKEVYVYMTGVRGCAMERHVAMNGKLFHEGVNELFEQI